MKCAADAVGQILLDRTIAFNVTPCRRKCRTSRSSLALFRGGPCIMRDIAKKAVLRNEEYDSLCERLINDPFYAYGAARGGPDAFCS